MDALSIKPGLFFWTIVNFLFLAFILGKFAIPAILKTLKEREEGIRNSIENANKANLESQRILKEATEKLDNAQLEVNKMVIKGKEQAEAIVAKAISEGETAKNAKIAEALKEIQRSKDNAIVEIRSEVASLVLDATEKILNQKLDRNEHLKLVESYMQKLPNSKN